MSSHRSSSPSNSNSSSNPSFHSTPSYDVISRGDNGFESSSGTSNSDLEGGENDGRTTWLMAAFLLVNAALGAGLLNYPVAYDRLGGIAFASVIQAFAVFLMATTMLVLVYCARVHNESSYHGVMRTMCGKRVMQAAAASIAITCFGICVTFLIIIGDQFDRLLATYIGPAFCSLWYAHRYFTMAVTAVAAIWPMCYFRRLDFLRHVNLLGVFASFYVIFLNIYTYYVTKGKEPVAPPYRTTPDSAIEFIAALPVVFFAYQTHEIVIPVHVSMNDKSLGAFGKATGLSLAILLVLYCLGGTYGYLTFGSKVAPDIMLMYDAHDPLVVAGILALVVKMVTTYPPVVFCGRDTIVRLLLSRKRQKQFEYQAISASEENSSGGGDDQVDAPILPPPPPSSPTMAALSGFGSKAYHIGITTVWNAIVLVLAIVTPNITVAIGFLGSLASCNVFIFPGLALVSLARRYIVLRRSQEEEEAEQHRHQQSSSSSSSSTSERDHLVGPSSNAGSSSYIRPSRRPSLFSLSNKWTQLMLLVYGLFIIAMGVIMFIIILIQVYRDFQNPIPHGAVCDETGAGGGGIVDATAHFNSTTTTTTLAPTTL